MQPRSREIAPRVARTRAALSRTEDRHRAVAGRFRGQASRVRRPGHL